MSNALQKLNTGTVQLHGETVDLTSSEGAALANDFAREEEGAVTMSYVQTKHRLSDDDLAGLAQNADLIRAISLARQLRIDNGRAAHDAALAYREKTVHVVGKIALDKMEPSRTRLEADARLDKIIAASGGPNDGEHRPTAIITVITSNSFGGTKTIEIVPPKIPPALETTPQPITIISRKDDLEPDPEQAADDADPRG